MMQFRERLCHVCILSLILILAACNPKPTEVPPSPPPLPSATPPSRITAAPALTLTPTNSSVYLPQLGIRPTTTPVQISLPVALAAGRPTPTAPWIPVTGGDIHVPILVYQHVTDAGQDSRYIVRMDAFKAQMLALRDLGYTPVTISTLAKAINGSGSLPAKPVVITFDDGNLDIYQNAFPVMRDLGFPGVFYVVSSRLKSTDYTNAAQLKEMIAAGWEIGSHSVTHADLGSGDAQLDFEYRQSKADLKAALNITIESFNYPYSSANSQTFNKAYAFGYSSAVCSGWTNTQTRDVLYCLPRREVKNTTTLEEFEKIVAEP